MEKFIQEALLYDFYGELLTEHQKLIYEDFVLNDLSLGEIAQERAISRQGVYDIVKRCRKQLEGYEAKLHLVERFIHTKDCIAEINQCARTILLHPDDHQQMIACIHRIETLSKTIADEL